MSYLYWNFQFKRQSPCTKCITLGNGLKSSGIILTKYSILKMHLVKRALYTKSQSYQSLCNASPRSQMQQLTLDCVQGGLWLWESLVQRPSCPVQPNKPFITLTIIRHAILYRTNQIPWYTYYILHSMNIVCVFFIPACFHQKEISMKSIYSTITSRVQIPCPTFPFKTKTMKQHLTEHTTVTV